MNPKICCLYRLNIWRNLPYPSRKIQAVTNMKVDSNKGICPDFGRNIFYGCRDDHDDLKLVDMSMNFPLCQLQELPCLSLVLLLLECIIRLIENACTSLFLTNPDPILCKKFKDISYIHMRLEAIMCEEWPPLREIRNHLKIIWRYRDRSLYI